MFKIFINDGKTKPPKDDIYYIVGKSGVFLKKKIGIVESITPVNQISILNDVQVSAKLKLKSKIRLQDISKVITFFKKVYENEKAEAMVVMLYNEKFGTYLFDAPDQEVTAGGIKYSQEQIILSENFIRLGTIHSHGSMSAFHSGTDRNDEFNWDGLHITIGHITGNDIFDITGDVVINGTRFTIPDLTEYIEGIEKVIQQEPEPQQQTFIIQKSEYKFPIEALQNSEVNLNIEWLNKVKKPVVIQQPNIPGTFQGYLVNGSNVFSNYFRMNRSICDDDGWNPCFSCIYRDYKVKMSDLLDDDEDDFLTFNYERGE